MILLVLFLAFECADRIQLSSVTIPPRALVDTTSAVGFHFFWVGQVLYQPCSYEQFKMDASRLDKFEDAVILYDTLGSSYLSENVAVTYEPIPPTAVLPFVFFVIMRPLV